jgi:hypothetical protein
VAPPWSFISEYNGGLFNRWIDSIFVSYGQQLR